MHDIQTMFSMTYTMHTCNWTLVIYIHDTNKAYAYTHTTTQLSLHTYTGIQIRQVAC